VLAGVSGVEVFVTCSQSRHGLCTTYDLEALEKGNIGIKNPNLNQPKLIEIGVIF
jgi:hypothetical protein